MAARNDTTASAETVVGREQECAAVAAALASASEGRRTVVVIEGSWGSGKSTLLDHAAARARASGFAVTTASARSSSIDGGEVGTSDAPLLVCLDDAHELEPSAARPLIELLDRAEPSATCIVLAGEARRREPWVRVRAEAARRRGSTFLALRPLDLAAVRELVSNERFAERVHRWCGGNPFMVDACVRHLSASGAVDLETGLEALPVPELVRHRVGALLDELEAPARWLADAAAIAAVAGTDGGPTSTSVIIGVAGLDAAAAAKALDQLIDVGLMITRELAFVGPLVADAIVEVLPGSRREVLHAALANALWSAGAPHASVVEHLRRRPPGRSEWAAGMLRSAAHDAGTRGDRALLVELLRRALDENPADPLRVALLADLARAEAALGAPTAIERLKVAMAAQPTVDRRLELQYVAGRSLLAAGRSRDAATVFEHGLNLAPTGAWHRLFRAGLVEAARLQPDLWRPVRSTVPRLIEVDREPLDPGARAALAELSFDMAARNEPAVDVAEIARRALPSPESAQIDDPALATAAGVLAYAGDVEPALAVLDAVLGRLGRSSTTTAVATGLRFRRGQCFAYEGDLPRAFEDLSFALATEQHGWAQYVVGAQASLARVQIERSELDAAASLLATALTAAQRRGSSMIAELYEARGRLNLERRRPKDAFSDFCEAGRCATEVFECRNPAMLGWRGGAALAAHRFGAVAAARRLAEDEVQAARHFGERRALARALRIRGVLEPGDAGLALLHEALFVIATSSARLEHANVLVDLGDALRRAGRLAEARTHVRSAGDLADRLGAVALAARAGESLRLLGGRPRRLRVSGPLSLTPGELRVAERARGGATNTEIAQELFVSTKAVEFHLANVFRKLGIRSRRELPDALPRQDGPADDGAE